jgi:hypothetical protein
MNDALPPESSVPSALSERSGVTDAARAQLLVTERWGLLATRSLTWNEVFSRASLYITMRSARRAASLQAVVSLGYALICWQVLTRSGILPETPRALERQGVL